MRGKGEEGVNWGREKGGYDPFHDLIWLDEISRGGNSGLGAGYTIMTMGEEPED